MSIEFEFLDTNAIVSSYTNNGVSYLELFIREYSRITGQPEKDFNVGCKKCISEYLKTYKLKKSKMAQTKNYKLKEKYNGLPLKFGSNIYVTNINLTDEYAEILLKKHNAEDIFDVYPKTTKETNPEVISEVKDIEVVDSEQIIEVQPKPKRIRKATSKKIKK